MKRLCVMDGQEGCDGVSIGITANISPMKFDFLLWSGQTKFLVFESLTGPNKNSLESPRIPESNCQWPQPRFALAKSPPD